jgi:hypothetical protein
LALAQAHAGNLLPYVSTTGAIRDQGSNGDCWVWSSAALTEVELKVRYGYSDRLSTQFVDSLMSASSWQNGGWFYDFANYVNQATILVPWANGNAAYVNGNVSSYCSQSLVTRDQIQQSPAYTSANLTASLLPTYHAANQADAIAAIKAALDNKHAVAFDFYTNFSGANGFDEWWAHSDETVIWPEPIAGTAGMTYDPDTWGGHEVAIIAYDDSDPVAANHYWVALNSWGTSSNRPNGCFRLPMVMAYDATFTDSGVASRNYYFGTLAVTVDHPAAAPPGVTVSPAATVVDLAQPFTLKGAVSGYPPFAYQWFNDGTAIPGATSAWFTDPVPATADTGSYQLVVTGSTGTLAVTSSAVPVVAESVPQLLVNPGFETAPASTGADLPGWSFTSTGLPSGYESPYRSSANAHTGSGYLFLGNAPDSNGNMAAASGSVSQTVTLPPGGTPTLALWMRMGTRETALADVDTLSLQVWDLQGNVLSTLRTYSNQQTDHLTWAMDTFQLSAYRGQSIQIILVWDCPTATQTFWRVDDLALTISDSALTLPAVASFSPPAGLPGTTLTLTGAGFTGAGVVTFNGIAQTAFTVLSDTQITTTVPAAATSGPVGVLNALGAGASSSSFLVKTLDFNGNGIDVLDMAALAMAYGSQPGSTNWSGPCDLNGDGTVGDADVAIFLAHF